MKRGDIRDRFDMAAAVADHRRAAHAGGPKQFIRSPTGRPRGADRFPTSKSRRRAKRG
jgi:hypothetical protein